MTLGSHQRSIGKPQVHNTSYAKPAYAILPGDCRASLAQLSEHCIDALITDPPYHLKFMGKKWDGGDLSFRPEIWQTFARVMKPGAHLVAFGGTRTFHRLACAIEDAGFELRDTLMWLYGQGFPKSSNQEGQWDGWGTALKPAWEPIILARKPLVGTVAENLTKFGTGALNIEATRVKLDQEVDASQLRTMQRSQRVADTSGQVWGLSKISGDEPQVVHPQGRWPANVVHDGSDDVLDAFPNAPGQIAKSVEDGRPQKNQVYQPMHRSGPIHIPRDEPDKSAARFFYCAKASRAEREAGCESLPLSTGGIRSETSGQHITRRDGGAPGPVHNNHPTVKPLALMRWLCRMVTPPNGVILDPFMGSGSTGLAAAQEGFRFVGCEADEHYLKIAQQRLQAQP